jgi:hypothetical protein
MRRPVFVINGNVFQERKPIPNPGYGLGINCRRLVGSTTLLMGGDMSYLWDETCLGGIC